MSTAKVDQKKRDFLINTLATMGAVGTAAVAVPFVESMLPSADAEAAAAPVRINISGIKPGEQKTVLWRGKPVWVVRRTEEQLNTLASLNNELRDPDSKVDQQPAYAKNGYRSIKPEFLVLIGVCTHLGCAPTFRPEVGSVDKEWKGGYYCSCHGSRFDLAGRVFKGVPAPINLEVPKYAFINDNEILVGVDVPTPAPA